MAGTAMRFAATIAVLTLFASGCAGTQQLDHRNKGLAAAPAALPLHRSLAHHTTACALAGGWCPLHVTNCSYQYSAASAGSLSSASGNVPSHHPLPHKPLLSLSALDVVAVVLASFALLLAASGGIGGGAILVPINLMVLGFGTNSAVALSNITIVGGTLANLAFNIGRRHPLRRDAPLIDWDLILVMEPATILGALLGGYVNKVLPGWLATVSLTLLLTLITFKTFAKGRSIYRLEQEKIKHKARLQSQGSSHLLLDVEEEGPGFEGLAAAGDSVALDSVYGSRQRSAFLSPEGPLALPPDSAGSSPPSTAEGGGLAAAEDPDLEAANGGTNGGADGGGGPPTPTSVHRSCSHPVPIGGSRSGSADDLRLPLLSPVEDQGDPQLAADGQRQGPTAARIIPLGGAWPLSGAGSGKAPAASPFAPADGGKPASAAAGSEAAWRLHIPWGEVGVLLLLLAGVVVSDILKGKAACASLFYWLAATAMLPATLATQLAVRVFLLRKGAAQRAAGHAPVEGDVEWTAKSTLVFPALCSFAGLAAGTFGVGGGIIKGPLMLEMGVLPEVAAATSATMIFFTSASASVVFISFGAVQWDYAALLFTMGLVCTAVGQILVMWAHKHIQTRSLLVFLMAAVLGISCVALAVESVLATQAAAAAHSLWHFHGICGNHSG